MSLLSFITFLLAAVLNIYHVSDKGTGSSDGNINYSPKSLQKNLEKITTCTASEKQEIDLGKWGPDRNMGSAGNIGSDRISGKFFRIFCDQDETGYVYIGRVKSCRAGGCSIGNLNEEFEFFDYYTIYDTGLNVVNVTVYNYEATHGHEITVKGWLKQFIGYSCNKPPLVPGKNIDAISGATISVNGITDDIVEKAGLLKQIKGRLSGPM